MTATPPHLDKITESLGRVRVKGTKDKGLEGQKNKGSKRQMGKDLAGPCFIILP